MEKKTKTSKEDEFGTSYLLSHHLSSHVLQNMYDIVGNILENLSNKELNSCEQVCIFWKGVVRDIWKGRVRVITKNIPIEVAKNSILHPSELRPYIKEENFECFIPEILEKRLFSDICEEPRCVRRSVLNDATPEVNEENSSLLSTKVAIIPCTAEIRMHRFSFTSESIGTYKNKGITDLSEVLDIPRDEVKFILWLADGNEEQEFLDMMPKCPTVRMRMRNEFASTYKGIAFSGKRVNALSLIYIEESLELQRNFSANDANETFKNIKLRYKIDQSKSVAFVFSDADCKCEIRKILEFFELYFPDIPILFYRDSSSCGGYYYYRPQDDCMKYCWAPLNFVLVWFD